MLVVAGLGTAALAYFGMTRDAKKSPGVQPPASTATSPSEVARNPTAIGAGSGTATQKAGAENAAASTGGKPSGKQTTKVAAHPDDRAKARTPAKATAGAAKTAAKSTKADKSTKTGKNSKANKSTKASKSTKAAKALAPRKRAADKPRKPRPKRQDKPKYDEETAASIAGARDSLKALEAMPPPAPDQEQAQDDGKDIIQLRKAGEAAASDGPKDDRGQAPAPPDPPAPVRIETPQDPFDAPPMPD